ncbi:MAG: acyl-CoA dehydrogenase family protein [Pseudomonadota bacterium]|nr:acyl-CoA dehydrogenase family protein [Pseudomonadota bacterium]
MADTSYLDWPFFDGGHRQLAANITAWSEKEWGGENHPEPADNAALDAEVKQIVAKLGKAGWLKYAVPAAYGGVLENLDARSLCIARQSLGYHSGLADFVMAMQGLGSGSITLYGSEEQKAKYLPGVAAGTQIAAFAISEAEGGSDVAAMTTSAKEDGTDYVINGAKTWISNAGLADHYVLFARTGESAGAKGISSFVVDADAPGLHVSERISVIAPHPLGTVTFNDCRVPKVNMLGSPGEGFKVAMATLDIFRATVGAAALGFARRALDEATQRAKSRHLFGQNLAEFQLIQEKIADMALKIDAAALLVFRAAWVKDVQAQRVTREAAMAKLYATETAQETIDQAVQIFGGTGVVSGVPVERLYREIRALRIYEGTSEIQKLIIAGEALKSRN